MASVVARDVCVVSLSSPAGGSWHSAVALAESLLERGVRLQVTMPSGSAATFASERLPDAEVIAIPVGHHGLRRDIRLAWRVRRAVQGQPTVVHANTVSAARASFFAVLFTRNPMIVHLRNSAMSFGERLLVKMIQLRKSPCSVIAVSRAASRLLPGDRDIRVICNPVRPPAPRPRSPMSTPVRVAVVANGRRVKGFDRLVDIALSIRDIDIEYQIFGIADPNMNKFVAEHYRRAEVLGVADRLNFCGRLPSLSAIYKTIDVVLVVSRRESFGRVAAEAMLAGVPTVIPDIPGLLETTGGEPYVWVFRSGDPTDAANALRRIIDKPEEAFDRAIRARRVAKRFEPTRVAREVESIYAELMARMDVMFARVS